MTSQSSLGSRRALQNIGNHCFCPELPASWSRRFSLALAVPRAIADAEILDWPLERAASQLGIWLQSARPLTVMVDIKGLQMLPGWTPSNQFIGWTFADPCGKSAAGTGHDLIVQLCENTLHLDDFERALAEESV